jgi:hypothetical protein
MLNPKHEDHPLLVVCIFAPTVLTCLGAFSSIRNPRLRHVVVAREPLNKVTDPPSSILLVSTNSLHGIYSRFLHTFFSSISILVFCVHSFWCVIFTRVNIL